MDDFLHLNIGNVLTMVVMLVAGAGAFFTLRGEVTNQSQRLESIEDTMKRIQDVLIKVAVQDERLAAMEQRSLMQGQRIDDGIKVVSARMDDLSRRVDAVSIRRRDESSKT